MAKSTFLQFCQAARRECKISGSGPTAVTGQVGILERLVNWVADADQELLGRWFDWDFLQYSGWTHNTVADTPAVAAPDDLGVWDRESFYLNYTAATHKKLTVLDYKKWRAMLRQGVKTSQKPDGIVILPDNSLYLEPPPDDVYSLSADYWKRPVKMVDATDTSPIPEEYERIIIARVKIAYGESESVGEILASGQVEYDDLLDKIESKYLPDQKARRQSDPGMMVVRPE